MTPTFTVPPPIIEALAKGLREMDNPPPAYWVTGGSSVTKLWMKTDAGDELVFLRGPDMERT